MSVTVDVDAGGSVTVDVDENAGGPAGGVLSGNYPDPGFAVPMATEAELTAHEAAHPAHPASGVSVASGAGVTATDVQAAIAQIVGFITSQEAGDSAAIAAVAASVTDEIARATAAEAAKQAHDADLDTIAALDSTVAGALATDGAGWIRKTYAQLKTALSLVKGDVGLGNVDNTSDANKPVSTAQAAADATKLVAGSTATYANLAALPAASAHTNEIHKTLDGGVYESTGSAWVQLVAPNGTYALPDVVLSKTADYTAHASEYVLCDTTTAGFTVTLPASPTAGQVVGVKKTSADANVVTLSPNVDGGVLTIGTQNHSLFVEYDGAAWRSRSGHYPKGTFLSSSVAGSGSAAGRTVSAAITGTPVADSGLLGFVMSRDARGNPLGFSLADVVGTPTFDVMTLDNASDDLVFVYDHALPGGGSGDQLRWRRPGHLLFGRSVGQPANTYRFRIEAVAADPSTMVDLVVLNGGTTSSAGNMLRLLRADSATETVFSVRADGLVGVGVLTPTQRFHVAQQQDATTQFLLTNLNASASARASIRVQGDAKSLFMEMFSSVFTTTALRNVGAVYTNTGADLVLGAGNTAERMRIDANGNLFLGIAALATTATNGFVSIPSSAGAPTGVPTLKTGLIPLHIDSTNSKLMAYIGGAWKGVTLA